MIVNKNHQGLDPTAATHSTEPSCPWKQSGTLL